MPWRVSAGLAALVLWCSVAWAQPVIVWRPPMNCATNDSLKWSGTAWTCTGGPTVTGSGTAGKSVRWASPSSIGIGAFTDDGTNVSVAGDFTIDVSASEPETPEIDYKALNGGWFSGMDAANTTRARDFVVAGQRPFYSCGDAVINSGSPTVTSAAECGFTTSLIGRPITGTGIPGGTTIIAVASATSATMSANATSSATIRATLVDDFTANDLIYCKHRGNLAPTCGVGVTPPNTSYRLQTTGSDSENAMGGLGIRIGPSQTGHPFAIYNSSNVEKFVVDTSGSTSFAGSLAINTNKFTVASASGNTVVAGTLQSTGLITATAGVTTGVNLTTTGTGDIVSGDTLSCANGAQLGDTTGDSHGITGNVTGTMNSSGPAWNLTNTRSATTSSTNTTFASTCTGTMDSSGAARHCIAASFAASATSSAGTTGRDIAAIFTATGGDHLTAIRTDSGSNFLNATNGSTCIGCTYPNSISAKLHVVGDALITTNLSVTGNINGYTQVTQAADQDVTNAGLTDSNTLTISTTANKIYAIDGFIIAGGNDTTGDYIFDFAVAAGTMDCTGTEQSVDTADAIQNSTVIATAAADTADTSVGTRADASLPIAIRISLACKVSNTTTLKYRFGNASASSGRTSRTMAGSYIKWKLLN